MFTSKHTISNQASHSTYDHNSLNASLHSVTDGQDVKYAGWEENVRKNFGHRSTVAAGHFADLLVSTQCGSVARAGVVQIF